MGGSGDVEDAVAGQAESPQHPQGCLVTWRLQALLSKDQDLGVNMAVGSGKTCDKSSPRRSARSFLGSNCCLVGPFSVVGEAALFFQKLVSPDPIT